MARQAGSNFYPCFFLLPRAKREAMEALYAFLRHTDDLGDDERLPIPRRREALDQWRTLLDRALTEEPATISSPDADPAALLLPALADAVRRFAIPREHLTAVLDGVEMDLDGRRYETFDDLAEYCHRVASAVGLACVHIWGFDASCDILRPARQCGLSFQLTNILRDLRADAAEGRLYLPQVDLRCCGYSADELARGADGAGFDRLMGMELDRARRLYREGAELFDCLSLDGRRVFGMMTSVYRALLGEIERSPRAVLRGRVRVSRWRRLGIAARWTLLPPRRLCLP
jgi:phytoene synthase